MNKNVFACPSCGSRNVEVRSTPPGGSALKELAASLAALVRPKAPLAGCTYIVCRECGHVAMLQGAGK